MLISRRVNNVLRQWAERTHIGLTSPTDHTGHLAATMDWLRRAQDATPDKGVSQTWLVRLHKWAPSYPETTGYIIPTFYRYCALSGDEGFRERAKAMADWECEVQHSTGGVLAGALGDSDQPTIFNTGQVLFGWVRAFEEENDERYRVAAARAAAWLCEVMDDDGCWRKWGSPMTGKQINTYNTRSAWGLARAFDITEETHFLDCAVKNCDWALTQRNPVGWLGNNCLQDNSQPFIHTIAYAMRGLLEVGVRAQRDDFVSAARVIGDAVLAALPEGGMLPGRLNERWQPTVRWTCLTGDAQIAINWGRLYQLTGERKYLDAAGKIINFVKRTQKLSGKPQEVGGIKGSHPIDGLYHPWQYPNWAAKFFADALMLDIANHGGHPYVIRKVPS